MSTILYAQRTVSRYTAKPGETSRPALVLDAVAALVPAEVLAAHALIIPMLTTKAMTAQGEVVTVISQANAATLGWVFWALLLLASGVYLVGRVGQNLFHRGDFMRMLIPPAAFVCWAMMMQSTVFDGAYPAVDTGARNAGAILGVITLGVLAGVLANSAAETDLSAPKHEMHEPSLNGHLATDDTKEFAAV
ncbi:hypothetical protein Lesp02_41380 [Lentzea sp. NBRC 105346]|uniref:hypothetical protein n=1 Tax=Lentzea sp. NBRC 105346 TaxID=3032205 RepID=UPI0024A1D6CB|nr:hypothetical protein [Lentzea sp. NBRC 105346]GLZ31950.1 hypothetical protein Lesp02_41380 [Lentzea sp. NBRC 105346]